MDSTSSAKTPPASSAKTPTLSEEAAAAAAEAAEAAEAAAEARITESSNFYRIQAWFPILLIAPSLIVIALVVLYPMGYSLYVSFTPFHLLRPEQTLVFSTKTMFRNYVRLAQDSVFWRSLLNTVIFLAVTVNVSFLISLALSQLLAHVTRAQSIMRTLLMIPMMFAPVLVGFQFAWFFNATVGLVNNTATSLGLMSTPKAWLVDVPTGMISIMIASIWMNVPMMTIILLAGTLSLPAMCMKPPRWTGRRPGPNSGISPSPSSDLSRSSPSRCSRWMSAGPMTLCAS